MKTLARFEAEIIIKRFIDCEHNKAQAARSLGISERGFRVRFLKIKADYPDLMETIGTKPKDPFYCSCFPTNEERLAYKDFDRVTRN